MSEENAASQAGAEEALRHAQAAESAANVAEADPKSFSAEYVADLRRESANYRIKAQQLGAPWEGVTEDDQKVWQEMIRITQKDPKAGAEYMQNIAKYLQGGQDPAPQEQRSMSQQDIARMVDERVSAATQSQIVADINREAQDLGYKPGSLDYMNLLWVAEHETNTDLKAAHKRLEESRESWVNSEIERKRAEMNGWPTPVRGGTPPAPVENKIKSFEDARKAMDARLDKLGQF